MVGLGCSSFSGFFLHGDDSAIIPDWLTKTTTADIATIDPKHPLIRNWVATIHYAIVEAGITLLDTAPWYGHGLSEQVVGLALEELFTGKCASISATFNDTSTTTTTTTTTTPSVSRADIILNTKVGRYDADPTHQFDFSRTATQQSLQRSLQRLRTSYIDVWQLHDAEFAPTLAVLLDECLPVMIQAQRDGHVRALGLTGYPLAVQRQLLQATLERFPDMPRIWDQALTYGHYTLHDQTLLGQPQGLPAPTDTTKAKEDTTESFADYCAKHNCACLAAAPLSMGLLTPTARPPDWHPASPSLKAACTEAASLCRSHSVNLAELALLVALAQPRIPTTLVGCKDIVQIQTLQRVCQRLSSARVGTNNDSKDDNGALTLFAAMTPAERTVYQQLCDAQNGPFAAVWRTGDYHWGGLVQVRDFWKTVPGTIVEEWQATTV